jgi:hypothetical protein
MHPYNHAFPPYHSNSLLFPIFLSSQLPIFPLYPPAAGGSRGKKEKVKVDYWEAVKGASIEG